MSAFRLDFPLLSERSDVVYLDNAATTQKPTKVLDAVRRYYETTNANVHRGVHRLSEEATQSFEDSRRTVADFLHAESSAEVVWTRGTTEALNLVAYSYGRDVLRRGSTILVSEMEHHSNIVPWQLIAEQTDAKVEAIRVSGSGELDLEHFDALLNDSVAIVAVNHVSNVLGTVNPIPKLAAAAHEVGAVLVVDGAQGLAHGPVDVQALGCDFYACSAHKTYGPTGIGALWGRRALLENMQPWQGGGEMIEQVSIERSTYQGLPYRFEAGTPNIAGSIGFAAACDYLNSQDFSAVQEHESALLRLATEGLLQLGNVQVVGCAENKAPVLSFIVPGSHPHDIGTLLDSQGIAVRTGHHCAMPLMHALGLPGTVRASIACYNDDSDIEKFVHAVRRAREIVVE